MNLQLTSLGVSLLLGFLSISLAIASVVIGALGYKRGTQGLNKANRVEDDAAIGLIQSEIALQKSTDLQKKIV